MNLLSTRSLLQSSASLMAARVTGAVVALLGQVILARVLGADKFGTFALGVALASVLSLVCTCGFPSIAAPYLARYRTAGEDGLRRGFLASAYRHLAVASAILCGVVAAVLFVPALGVGPELRAALLFGLACAPLMALMRLNGAIANARRRFALSYVPDLVFRPFLFLAAIMVASWAWNFSEAANFVGLLLGVICLLAIVQYHLLRPFAGLREAPKAQYDSGRWRRKSAPLIIVTIFTSFFGELDLLLLGVMLPTDQIAVFSVCLRITAFIAFGIHLVHQLVLPDLSEARADGRHDLVTLAVQRANRINLAATVATMGGLYLFGGQVLRVFGPEFEAGFTVLMVLASAQLVRAAAGPVMQLLTVGDMQHRSVVVLGLSLALLALLNVVLVPLHGATGAAFAVVLTTVFWCGLLSLQVARHVGYKPWQLTGAVETGAATT
jgi:O-antigen/teichoic acid export membrane protein